VPTCYACKKNVERGQADGWLMLRRLVGVEQPSESLGLFCRARCVAEVLYALDPWDGES
jgi:hypothetical protein